mgnify:CR=1 FL=1
MSDAMPIVSGPMAPPTDTMDRVCEPYTECTAGQYQSTAPTATAR